MNFLHIPRRFVFIFFTLQGCVFFGIDLSSANFQELGHPYIQTCLPEAYGFINHYNSIVQDSEGFIYIGARNSILRFDGSNWKHLAADGDAQLVKHKTSIYAYTKTRLGTLRRTAEGKFEFREGIHTEGDAGTAANAEAESRGYGTLKGNILQVLSSENNLYIFTSEGLFSLGNDSLTPVKTGFTPERIFPAGKGIFILAESNNIYNYDEGNIQEIQMPGGMEHLSSTLPVDERTLFFDGINNKLLLSRSPDSFIELRHTAKFLKESEFTCAVKLSSGYLALGTRKAGVIFVREDGRILSRISGSDGLYNNDIIQLMTDATNNLWVLHEQAVSCIEIPSAFSFFDSKNGLHGNVKDLTRYQGTLFAATSHGLFNLLAQESQTGSIHENTAFSRISEIEGECRCLAATPRSLFVGGNGGLFKLTGQQTRMIIPDPVNALYYDPGQNLLLAGTDSGIRIFNPDDLKEIKSFSLPKISIDDIALSPTGFLWLSSRSGAIYRSTKPFSNHGNLSYSSYVPENVAAGCLSYIDLIEIPGNLYFSCLEGLFRFDPGTQPFRRDSVFHFPMTNGTCRIVQMAVDMDKNLWISIDNSEHNSFKIWLAGPSADKKDEINPLRYRRINSKIINCFYAEPGNIMWIGTHEGILRFDPAFTRPETSCFQSHITGVTIADNPIMQYDYLASRAFSESLRKDRINIPHSKNKIRFDFLSTDFNSKSQPLFQYRLSGLHDQWSAWSTYSSTEFSGLSQGNYEFQVHSQDIFGSVSEADTFLFRIKSPIYLTWYVIIFYLLLILVFIYTMQRWRNLQQIRERYHLEEVVLERTESLIKEKEKTENLLANVLPKTTADELMAKGKVTSSKFKMVTVLFADIQGFTKIAEHMNPEKLIDQLDQFYFHFDSVVGKYNIEKIKTIGDAYMAAGGIPIKNRTNPVEVILAALEMQQHMKKLKESQADIWDLRIGLHTGSVIAGVIGQKKFSYDIWGDTVNTASRMESSGEIGRVNISATTYKLVKDFFQCEFRGKMPVKYKGDIAMFFVTGLNPSFSEADKITPNKSFLIQIQLLRLLDLEEFVLEKLLKELPEDLFFHNVEHTSHVYFQAELLGRAEKVSEEDLLILRTAALMHDMGYINRMDDHESRSVEYAREILPMYRYKEEQIDSVCDLIMSTRMPPKPENLLEQILCDANLDHIGRVDFLIQSDKLFQEYRIRQKIKTKKDWNHYQINFLETHDFYTEIANKMREVPKDVQIENIRQYS